MADDIKNARWDDDVPICVNEEFEIGYRSDDFARPVEGCGPELAMESAA